MQCITATVSAAARPQSTVDDCACRAPVEQLERVPWVRNCVRLLRGA